MDGATDYQVPGFEYPAAGGYHDWQSTCSELKQLGIDCPRTEYAPIGTTFQKREIPSLMVNFGLPGRRKIIVVGCHHAKEWISVEVPLAFARKIASGATSTDEGRLLDGYSFVFVPMLNPDGHVYSVSPTTRLWRKNRSEGDDIGVDLNRNYSVHWNEGLTGCKPGSDMFRGPRAFSEAESCALRDLVYLTGPDIVLSYHSFGEKVLYPWAFEAFSASDPALVAAKELAAAYVAGTGRNGSPYDLCAARDQYGPGIAVGGDMGDWVLRETKGACLPLTIELSPVSANPGFVLPSLEIPGVVAQNWNGLLQFLQAYRSIKP
jgi:carboxypeptidase T